MRLTTQIQNRFDNEEKILRAVYDLMEPNTPTRTTGEEIAGLTALTPSKVGQAVQHFQKMGLVKVEIRYNVDGPSTGRSAWWSTLKPSKGLALELLEKEHRRELMEGAWNDKVKAKTEKHREKVAIARDNDEHPLKAVAGPDAPSPLADLAPLRKSEPRALIEAAKQYRGRKELKALKLKELRDGGINVADDAIPLPIDERLEVLLLVLPYVEQLEKSGDRLAAYQTRYREMEASNQRLGRELEALRRWRDGQVARAVNAVPLQGESANGHAESGAARDRAEDRAGSPRPNGSAGAGGAESTQREVEAREAQPRSEAPTAAR